MTNNIDINKLGVKELQAYINGLQAFNDFAFMQEVISISKYSFNTIKFILDNGIIIKSTDTTIYYFVIDIKNNEEVFYKTYKEALNKI